MRWLAIIVLFVLTALSVSASIAAEIACMGSSVVGPDWKENIGDFVAYYEDGRISPTAPERSLFNFIYIPGKVAKVRSHLESKFGLDTDEVGTNYWKNPSDGKYYEVQIEPNYKFTIKGVSPPYTLEKVRCTYDDYAVNKETIYKGILP